MIHYQLYYSVSELPEEWNHLSKQDIFLQKAYLKAAENASPTNIFWFYIGVFNDEKLVAIALVQRISLYLKDMFRNQSDGFLKQVSKNLLSYILKGNMLVLGNMMHTGQHGFILTQAISQQEFFKTIFQALVELNKNIKKASGKKIRVILLKDYFASSDILELNGFLTTNQLHQVMVQPNMVMICDNWQSFEDYLSDLNKKYRRRYKTARRKSYEISKKELSLEEIKSNVSSLYKLYKHVSDNAGFNTFLLPQDHFISLKEQLQERFKIFGYFYHGKLIGFYSLILNGTTLETYFLGYDSEKQHDFQLYLNMLYDMVSFGINQKFQHIVYARTAMEIKSSVGAKPQAMVVYMQHTNKLINGLFKHIFGLMKPADDWEERHPFKL